MLSAVLGIVPDETRGGVDRAGINGGAGTSACASEYGDALERVDVLKLPCVVLLFFAPAGSRSPSATSSADAALASESLEIAEAAARATVVLVELKFRSRA